MDKDKIKRELLAIGISAYIKEIDYNKAMELLEIELCKHEKLVKKLTLTNVVDKLKDRNDELSELSKDLIRKVEKKIPYISLPEDEGLYTALHKLKNEAYKSL